MNYRLSRIALIVYCVGYLILFGAWVAIEFNRDRVPHPDQLISYIQNTLAALTGHVFTMINPTAEPPPVVQPKAAPVLLPTNVTKE